MSAEQLPLSTSTKPDAAVIYCRVSTTKQTIQGHGLQSQEMRCREYAEARGYEVLAVFPDDVSGGGDFMERPGMVALLSFLKAKPDMSLCVIFDDLKRFARDAEFHIKLRRELNAVGAKVECLNFKFEDTPEGEFIETIMAAQGELERKQNRRQVVQKMQARVRAGYYLFAPAYGYTYEKVDGHGKMLVPDGEKAENVRNAIEGLASGRFRTIAEVKRYLEEVSDLPRTRHGEIRFSTVTEILRRPLYAGLINVPSWGIKDLPGKHEPLVSYEAWSKAQTVLDGKALAPARKDISEDFPLRGFVLCGDCGKPLTACWSKSKTGKMHPYYLCAQRGCPSKRKSIRRADIEEPFEESFKALRPRKTILSACKAMFSDAWDLRARDAASISTRLKQEASQIQIKIDRLVDRLVEADTASVVSAYEQRIERLQHDKRLSEDRLKNAGVPATSFEDTFELALRFLVNPWKMWDIGHLELRRTLLRMVFAEPVSYCRKTGLRTPKTALPFNVLEDFSAARCGMVEPRGIEPLTSSLRTTRSTN